MRIFFSYSRSDEDFALKLASDLLSAGVKTWIDQNDVPPGMPWPDAVEAALAMCPVFLLVLSPRSARSRNVRNELHFASTKNKHIIPVVIEPCEVPILATSYTRFDFTGDYARTLHSFSPASRGCERARRFAERRHRVAGRPQERKQCPGRRHPNTIRRRPSQRRPRCDPRPVLATN